MIEMRGVSKSYPIQGGFVRVFDDINLIVRPGQKIGILGRNGAGKSTMIRLIGGSELPDKGTITRTMTVSWPLAFGGAFQSTLTGLDNLRFICRIYGVDPEKRIDFVNEFSELGKFLREPVRNYSAGMRARLAFAVSMAIEFECFLIDGIIAVGDSRFHQKCQIELFEKRADRAMIIVSHNANYIKAHCQSIAVIESGILKHYDDVDEGVYVYSNIQ